MSKAFTRENTIEADAPDRVILPYANLVTRDGLASIEANVGRWTDEHAAAMAADDEVGLTRAARELRYWRARLESAEVSETPPGPDVRFGSRVSLKRTNGETLSLRIVGTDEADPRSGTVSYASPLAQAMLGRNIGDAVVIGRIDATIVAIQ